MSKVKINYDKQQLPQVIAIGVISAGLLGYVAITLIGPPKSTQAVATNAPAAAVAPVAKAAVVTPNVLSMTSLTDGAAPSEAMPDPFIPCLQPTVPTPPPDIRPQPALQDASAPRLNALQPMPLTESIRPLTALSPGLPAGPAVNSPAPAPVAAAPAPIAWTVTGVLLGSSSNKSIAVLRNADSRRFVVLGDTVDGEYRLIGVDRFGVTLSSGKTRIRLKLGGDAPKSATPQSESQPAAVLTASAPTVSNAAVRTPAAGAINTSPSLPVAVAPSDTKLENSTSVDPL